MNEPSHPTANRPDAIGTGPSWLEWRGSGCILVVDDDPAVGTVLSRALGRIGFTTGLASDGRKAVSLFNADPERYALVLLDYRLPGMDSKAVFHEIRAKRPDLPVILMSGYDKQEALEDSDGMDLAGFVHKPFTLNILTAELRNALSPSSGVIAGRAD